MKKHLLFLTGILALLTSCENIEPEYFANDDLIVEKVQVSSTYSKYPPYVAKSFILRRVKNPSMVAELNEDGLRGRSSNISYKVGDTIRVSLIDKSLFRYTL